MLTHLDLPPPVTRPCLIDDAPCAILVGKQLLWCVSHHISERRVAHKFPQHLDWIAMPKLALLRENLAIGGLHITGNVDWLVYPLDTTGKRINLLEERTLVMERR